MLPQGCWGEQGKHGDVLGRQRSTPDEQKRLGSLIHRRNKPLRRLDFFARSDMFGANVRGLWPFCSPLVERWDPAIALLSLRKSAFCFPEDPGRWRGSSGEAAEGVSRGMKRILRAWRAARKALLFEGFRGLWDRIRCGRKSGLVRLPRLGSRVRIPSPAPVFLNKIKRLKTVLRGRSCLEGPGSVSF